MPIQAGGHGRKIRRHPCPIVKVLFQEKMFPNKSTSGWSISRIFIGLEVTPKSDVGVVIKLFRHGVTMPESFTLLNKLFSLK
jgi:hypothetical protein